MLGMLFLLSLGLLIVSLLLSALLRRFPRVTACAVLVFFCTSLLLAAGLLIRHAYGQRFAFLNPELLVLLLLPISLLAARIFRRSGFSRPVNYPPAGQIRQSFSLTAFLTRWTETGLALAALALFIVALARPVNVSSAKLPPTQGIDIMLVIDASASMNRQDFFPSRFVAAQKNAINFISKRFNDRIGLTVFAKNAFLAAPLTLDHDAVQELVASLYLGIVDPNLTAVGDALGVASNHLKDSSAKSKIILLLTDGSNNTGTLDPLLAAKAAAAYGIKVYTIATASPPGTSVFSSQEEEIDEGLLLNIAKETGGEFYRAKNEMELQQIYDKINELEKTDFTQAARISRHDAYRPWLLAGLAVLLAGFALAKLIFIKVP